MPCECTDMGTDLTEDEVEEIAEEMSSENMRKLMQIRQNIFDDAHGNIKRAQKRQKKYYDIQNATKEVLDIGDIVVKERQGNLSRKGGRLEKKREEYFFVVKQIMENGNIQLRDWNTNTIVKETVPPQQLKKIYLDDMKMEDIERNFKWHKVTQNDEIDSEMTRIRETTPTASLTTCRSNIGPINTSTTSLDDVDFTHSSHTN